MSTDIFSEATRQYIAKLEKAARAAVDDYNSKFAKYLQDSFEKSVTAFYDDYKPGSLSHSTRVNPYRRNYSLYNLLVIKRKSDGSVESMSFDPSRMTGFRDGSHPEDGLYDQVFRKGWHGGAGSGGGFWVEYDDGSMYYSPPHPDPPSVENDSGVPYWRDTLGRRWDVWYMHPAPIMEVPPLQMIHNDIHKWEATSQKTLEEVFERRTREFLGG